MIDAQGTQHAIFLVNLAQKFDLRDFVETGTSSGSTFRAVREYFNRAFTIELYYSSSDLVVDERFFYFSGSSGARLPEILQNHRITKALFFLDAHGNRTLFKDDGNNQVPAELEAIERYAPSSLVVIDDISAIQGKFWINDSYPFLVPQDWNSTVYLPKRIAVLHRGGYDIPNLEEFCAQ